MESAWANWELRSWMLGLAGEETKSLVGREDLGSPGRFVIKRVVQEIKALAREYAQRLGDPAFLRDIERAMEREEATVQKRLAATGSGQARTVITPSATLLIGAGRGSILILSPSTCVLAALATISAPSFDETRVLSAL